MPVVDSIAGLIAQFEGYGTSGAPSITNGNNPGAIMAGPFAARMGASGTAPNGTAEFPDLATGYNALQTLIQTKLDAGLNTPQSLIDSWEGVTAGGGQAPGNTAAGTANYAQMIAGGFGIGVNDPFPANTPASQITPGAAGNYFGDALTAATAWIKQIGKNSGTPGNVLTGTASTVGAAQAAVKGITGPWWANLSLAQIAALIIGIGLIIGGVFFLRPVQDATVQIVRTGKKAAGLFA